MMLQFFRLVYLMVDKRWLNVFRWLNKKCRVPYSAYVELTKWINLTDLSRGLPQK